MERETRPQRWDRRCLCEGRVAVTVHNPDRFMSDLRTIVAQGRKRIGFLIGAGAAAGLQNAAGGPLIPAIDLMTTQVVDALRPTYPSVFDAIDSRGPANIEAILTRVRSLSGVIGTETIDGLDGAGYALLGRRICSEIGVRANVSLPPGDNAFRHLVNWVVGTDREHPVELFTTNYDLLLEEALEEVRAPYFDGFTGGREPFFDAVSIATNDLPAKWTRLWKLHGSLGWKANGKGEIIRNGDPSATHLIFPEHMKYDLTQKAPYAALFDRLKAFLSAKDTLLIACGFSFADTHVGARLDESLAANPSASLFAFQYKTLAEEPHAAAIASKRPNFSVYARDKAVVNGIQAPWMPGDLPSKDWEPIRSTYWKSSKAGAAPEFLLGDFSALSKFLALSRSGQALDPTIAATPPGVAP